MFATKSRHYSSLLFNTTTCCKQLQRVQYASKRSFTRNNNAKNDATSSTERLQDYYSNKNKNYRAELSEEAFKTQFDQAVAENRMCYVRAVPPTFTRVDMQYLLAQLKSLRNVYDQPVTPFAKIVPHYHPNGYFRKAYFVEFDTVEQVSRATTICQQKTVEINNPENNHLKDAVVLQVVPVRSLCLTNFS